MSAEESTVDEATLAALESGVVPVSRGEVARLVRAHRALLARVAPPAGTAVSNLPDLPIGLRWKDWNDGYPEIEARRAAQAQAVAIVASEISDAIAAHDAGETVNATERAKHVLVAIGAKP